MAMQDTFPAMKRIKGSFRASFALIILAADGKWAAVAMVRPNHSASSNGTAVSWFSCAGISETAPGS